MENDLEKRYDPQDESQYDAEEHIEADGFDGDDDYADDADLFDQDAEAPEAQAGEEALSTDKYFNKLMNLLEKQLTSAKRLPFGRGVINLDECLLTLQDMRDNFPQALSMSIHSTEENERITQTAAQTAKSLIATADERAKAVRERAQKKAQSMIYAAQNDAEEIIANARQQAERIVSNDEIVLRAEQEASAIIKEARAKAQDTRLKSSEEASRMLSDVEETFRAMLKDVKRLKNDVTQN